MFTWLGAKITSILSTYVLGVVTALVSAITPIALTAMTLWVILYGWAVLRNAVSETVPSFVWKVTKIGLVFAFADTAFAIACNEDERVTVAGGADITFLKSTTAGQRLTAHAVRRVVSGRNGLYDVSVTDETGDVVAEVRGRSLTTNRPQAG